MKKPNLMITLLVIAAILVVLAVVIAIQPADFRVARSTTIAAPQSVVFSQVNDLHAFQEWSPWAKMDPECKTTFEGPTEGIGTRCAWSGNNKVGAGSMTITESRPGELVQLRLDFLKPFKATNIAEFTFKSEGDQTTVTWSMTGKRNFLFKAFGLFMDCDKMIGPDFEKGLASMKAIAEAEARSQNAMVYRIQDTSTKNTAETYAGSDNRDRF